MLAEQAVFPVALCLLSLPLLTAGRQECYSCEFKNKGGSECISRPADWSGAKNTIMCENKCLINVFYEKENGRPSYVYRGCLGKERATGCMDMGTYHSCFLACDDRKFCNDLDVLGTSLERYNGAPIMSSWTVFNMMLMFVSVCVCALPWKFIDRA